MRKLIVIDDPQVIPLHSLIIPLGGVIVAEVDRDSGGQDKFILAHTDQGYIFQYWDQSAGHSGWRSTPQEVITHAIHQVWKTRVYLYPTLKEAVTDFFNK